MGYKRVVLMSVSGLHAPCEYMNDFDLWTNGHVGDWGWSIKTRLVLESGSRTTGWLLSDGWGSMMAIYESEM